jgi:uncharacterized protein
MDSDPEFEWDDNKNVANWRKHRVDFRIVEEVFSDPFLREYLDEAADEERFNALGMAGGRLLHVTYTLRGDCMRIISARRATRHEKRKYHEIQA